MVVQNPRLRVNHSSYRDTGECNICKGKVLVGTLICRGCGGGGICRPCGGKGYVDC